MCKCMCDFRPTFETSHSFDNNRMSSEMSTILFAFSEEIIYTLLQSSVESVSHLRFVLQL